MKIAVTHDNGEIFQHFGKTESFKVYSIENGQIISSEVISSDGFGHEALADLLSSGNADLLICGGIGEGARAALDEAGIAVIGGVSGSCDEAVAAFLKGELADSAETCGHHHDEESHCGGCPEEGSCSGCHGHIEITGKNVGRTVQVHYRGTLNDGSQFDSSYDRGEPLEFVCGAGMMIPGFDQAVADMDEGQTIEVHLMPEEAYGYANPNAVMNILISQLPGSENLAVGQRVMVSDQMGRRFPVTVAAKDEASVTLDANHPMAGKELNFTIELLSIN